MGCRTSISVEIGGKVPASALADLVDAINSDGVSLDWMGGEVSEDAIRESVAAGASLTLVESETYAEVPEIAAFCEEHGLFYRLCWDAYPGSFEAGGEMVDAEGGTAFATNGTDGDVCLFASEIRALGSWEPLTARLDRLTRPLPALEIVEG